MLQFCGTSWSSSGLLEIKYKPGCSSGAKNEPNTQLEGSQSYWAQAAVTAILEDWCIQQKNKKLGVKAKKCTQLLLLVWCLEASFTSGAA